MDLALVGVAGHGREVAAALQALERAGRPLGILKGFLDDDPLVAEATAGGLLRLGDLASGGPGIQGAVLGVGYPEVKARIVGRLANRALSWPPVVHPDATLGPRVEVGQGSLIQAGAVLSTDIRVGDFVTVNLGATVSHDCRLGDYVTLSPGASVGGTVTLDEGAFVGLRASVVQGVRIGAWSVVGAGAVVLSDVLPNTVVAGVPARVINTRPEGWQRGAGDKE
jgi:sugar O-acyltransferase (sialic acid O-acetyltransferase NeuD family)